MKQFLALSLILVANTGWAFVPVSLIDADNYARRQALADALQKLDLVNQNDITYHQFESSAGKYADDFVDLSLNFQVWQSNTRAFDCATRMTVDKTADGWSVRRAGGMSCREVPPRL